MPAAESAPPAQVLRRRYKGLRLPQIFKGARPAAKSFLQRQQRKAKALRLQRNATLKTQNIERLARAATPEWVSVKFALAKIQDRANGHDVRLHAHAASKQRTLARRSQWQGLPQATRIGILIPSGTAIRDRWRRLRTLANAQTHLASICWPRHPFLQPRQRL